MTASSNAAGGEAPEPGQGESEPGRSDGADARRESPVEEQRRLLIEALAGAVRAGGVDVGGAGGGGAAATNGASAQEAGGDTPGVGCGQCGCSAPAVCSACPVCKSVSAALDPQFLERIADAATLVAEGLRAAARRLATMDEGTRR